MKSKTGSTWNEFGLGVIELSLEGTPQLLVLGLTMTHWHGDFETTGLDFYSAYMNVPLCIWYHTLYCKPNTKFAIISKILVLAFDNSSYRWNDYIKRYKIEDSTMIFEIESNKYQNSNLFNMAIHQLGYIITAPLKGN